MSLNRERDTDYHQIKSNHYFITLHLNLIHFHRENRVLCSYCLPPTPPIHRSTALGVTQRLAISLHLAEPTTSLRVTMTAFVGLEGYAGVKSQEMLNMYVSDAQILEV